MSGAEGRFSGAAKCALALATILGFLLPPAHGGAQAPTGPSERGAQVDGSIALVSQPAWVGSGGEFTLRLQVDTPRRVTDLEVAVTVYSAVDSRSEFTVTLDNRATRSSLTTLVYPLSSLVPDPSGVVTVPVRVQDSSLARDPGRVSLGREDGVYPVRVDLRETRGGKLIDRFTTHLVHLPGEHPAQKLGVAMILPLHRPPSLPGAEGEQVDGPASVAESVAAARSLPVTMAPTPETLAGLAARGDERTVEVLSELRRVAAERTVLQSTYVPVSLPALLSSGLDKDVDRQLERGATTMTDVLRTQPDTTTWLSEEALDSASLSGLARRRVSRVIVSGSQVEPIPDQRLTLTQPFELDADDEHMPALATDTGLSAHFDNQGNQVLRAHQLLADLAVLYLDQPSMERRAVVALPRRGWVPARQFVDVLASGLAQNPMVEPVSIDSAFSTVKPATSGRGTPLVRAPLTRPPDTFGKAASDLAVTRQRLDALGSILDKANPAVATLEHQQLLAQSSELRSESQRQPYLEAVQDGIASQLSDIRMPEGRSITLTARTGEVPVTFQNRTGSPVRVVVKVESDKLDFPTGTTREVELARRNTVERFSVVARTSGAFPLRITLESPDGNLIIGRARLTVRSTAAAGVSVFVSLGAAAFLAIWWGRHALKGRRSRQLVTSSERERA